MLRLHNTLTRELENFRPLRQENVKVYYCGPTPYNYAHIGNLRTYLFEDFVVRTLRYLGWRVDTVMNVTDIDDKTIRDSLKQNVALKELTEKYTEIFLEDIRRLRIVPADKIVPISTLVDDMVAMIQKLIDRGYAYVSDDGSVYYSISKFKKYGELAHLDMSGMKSSVRIDNDEYEKDSVADFALWKAYDEAADGENRWVAKLTVEGKETELPGRPGWHIECSACNMKHHGPQIDIHMGAIDNLFPHHQNEVAQTEACTGKPFAKYWMHGGHLLVDNKKMAKSAGNFYTLRDVVEKIGADKEELVCRGFRLMALQTQYRENFNFTFDRLDASMRTVSGFDETFRRLSRYDAKEGKVNRDFRNELQGYVQAYVEALENDFSTAEALAVVFAFQTFVNASIDSKKMTLPEKESVIEMFRSFDSVLALFDFALLEAVAVDPELDMMLEDRNVAKASKDFATADALRDEILAKGYRIVDTKDGSFLEPV
ncbi:MAG: cysteinyl-tRNA synthetase [Patescibacteria group bacterium]|nr:cysteinyl-tRNA synthetase [Patescibacteria group bacterium]